MRKIINPFKILLTIFVILSLLLELIIIIFSYSTPSKSDIILILGSRIINSQPGSMLKYRLDKAIELYNQGYGKIIIVSGGQGKNENMPEGQVMKNYLVERGVSEKFIMVENKSTSTFENIKYSKEMLGGKEASITIVTSNFHIFRTALTSKKLSINSNFAPCKIDVKDIWYFLREVPAVYKYLIKY